MITTKLTTVAIRALEKSVEEQGQGTIHFTRFVNLEEEELVKFKKSKPKGTTQEDLENILAEATIDLSEFTEPGCTEIYQRCPLV